MFGFGLLNALFLAGIAAAAIPIIIHLIHKRHSRSVDFPSLMFLRLIDLRMASRQRLREFIVLALRIAAIALFAFALSKPILRTRTASAGPRTSTTAVIIIDNSFSMNYKESGVTGLEKAREKAQEILDTLAPGDNAAIIPVAGYAPADSGLSSDLAGLVNRVEMLKEMPSAGSLEGALDLAVKALEGSKEINRELYVISDFQQLIWEPVLESETLRSVQADVVLVDVSAERQSNMAVSSIEVGHRPGQAGVVEVKALVHNYSVNPMRARVALVLDGKTRSEVSADVPARGDEAISFTQTLGEESMLGYIFLKTDGLATDNKRYFASAAGDAIRVLAVNGDPSDIWDIDETYYLETALSPLRGGMGGGDLGSASPVRPRVVTEAGMRKEKLSDYAVVILANASGLDEEIVSNIQDFVRKGGGLIIFSGERVVPEEYNKLLKSDAVALLPCSLIGQKEYEEDSEPISLVPTDWEHGVFSVLKDIRDVAFDTSRFNRIMICECDRQDASVSVLARFSNGFPALVERKYGAGTVLFFASTCDRDWTNFPLRPIYLPVVHQMVRYIANRQQRLKSYFVGEPVRYLFPPTEKKVEVSVTDPAGRAFEADVEPSGEAIAATFSETLIPGIYSADIRASSSREDEHFAVNVDISESDLVRVPAARLKKMLGPEISVIDGNSDLTVAIWRMRTGVKLWDYFLYLALLALLAEGWLANRFVPKTNMSRKSSAGERHSESRMEKISVN